MSQEELKAINYLRNVVEYENLSYGGLKSINDAIKIIEDTRHQELVGIDGEEIIERLAQAHMKGQFNAGCREPSYSNARADVLDSAMEAYKTFGTPKELNLEEVEELIKEWEDKEFGHYQCDCVPANPEQVRKLAKAILNHIKRKN